MLCCLIGGALVAALARSARRDSGRARSPIVGLVFGLGTGMLFVAVIISLLVPLGVVHVTGPLPPRIALLVVPGLAALASVWLGGPGSLLSRSGTMAVVVGSIGGALAAEEVDLHLLTLHSAPGVVAGLAVHLPGFVFFAAGLVWRSQLPAEAPLDGACGCDEPRRSARRLR